MPEAVLRKEDAVDFARTDKAHRPIPPDAPGAPGRTNYNYNTNINYNSNHNRNRNPTPTAAPASAGTKPAPAALFRVSTGFSTELSTQRASYPQNINSIINKAGCRQHTGTAFAGNPGGQAKPFSWSCLRRAPFHRGKGAKTRRWLRPPDPGEQAAVRHRRAGKGVSCCRLGEFLRGCRCAARIMRPREFDSSCRRRNAGKWPHRVPTSFDGPRSTRPGILAPPCHSERSEESVSHVGERILRPVPGLRMTGRRHTGPRRTKWLSASAAPKAPLQALWRYDSPESLAVVAPLSKSHWRTRRQPLRPLLAQLSTLLEPNSRGRMMRGLHADSAQMRRGGNGCPHWQLPYDVRPPPPGGPGAAATGELSPLSLGGKGPAGGMTS